MAVPTVYRWDDVGAPQLTNPKNWAQYKAMFQALFIDGYVGKSAIGWDCTFDDGLKTVTLDMVGNPATENLMRVELNHSTSNTGVQAIYNEHQGTNEFYDSTYDNTMLLGSNYNGSGTIICPWIVIATDRGIYWISGYSDIAYPTQPPITINNSIQVTYMGNFVNDGVDVGKNNQCLWGVGGVGNVDDGNDAINHGASYFAGDNKTHITTRNYSNVFTPRVMVTLDRLQSSSLHQYLSNYSKGLKYPYLGNQMIIKPFGMYDKYEGVYFGKMPACYVSEHDRPMKPTAKVDTFTGTGTYAGDTFYVLYNGSSEFYINVSENWVI